MSGYTVKALGPDPWDAFARLAERHNGVFGGCWCTWFHTFQAEKTFTAEGNRALKQRLVDEGRAHAALVLDGDEAVAWCEYGTPEELPNIYHRKQYEAELDRLPEYRVTWSAVRRVFGQLCESGRSRAAVLVRCRWALRGPRSARRA